MQYSGDSEAPVDAASACASPARPRGRPRGFDRDAALGAAMHLFWRKGYAATAISDLTAAMGIGTTSLYAAFGSKEALFAEACRHYGACYESPVWARFDGAASARAAVAALLLDSAAALTRPPGDAGPLGCMLTLADVDRDDAPDLDALLRDTRTRLFARVEARLARARDAGELPPALDLRALARLVLTLQNGLSLQARDGADHAELDAAARLALAGWEAWVAR